MSSFLVILLSSVFFFVQVHSQVVNLSCPIYCPEVPAIYHCVITSAQAQWEISGGAGGINSFSAGDAIGRTIPVGNFFTAKKTGSNSFSLNFNANVEFSNTVVVDCRDLADGNGNTNSRQCIVELEGPPTTSPSLLSYTAISSISVNISWSPSSEQCLAYYRVAVINQNTNKQEVINTTSTSLNISNRLEGVQYSYTVAVVDGANRRGPQNSGCFNLDTPEQVPGLIVMANDFKNETQIISTGNILVKWMQLTSSCPRPDANYYRVVHNVTNNDINITVIVPTPTTTLIITGAIDNFTYFVQLEAYNTLGFGPATVTNIVVTTSTSTPLFATTSITTVAISLTSTAPTIPPIRKTISSIPLSTATTIPPIRESTSFIPPSITPTILTIQESGRVITTTIPSLSVTSYTPERSILISDYVITISPTLSCPRDASSLSLTAASVTVTFLLTAIFSSILTLDLTLLFVCVYIKFSGLTRKEPVKPVEEDMYEEVRKSDSTSPVPLTTNPAYGPVGQ